MPRATDRPCRAEWNATTSAAPISRAAFTVTSSGSPGPSPTPYSRPLTGPPIAPKWPLWRGTAGSFGRARDRVDGGGGDRAAPAPAADGEELQVRGGQRLFGLHRADETDRDADDGGRARRSGGDHLQQVEQRGRGVADGDDGAVQPVAPQVQSRRGAGGPHLPGEIGGAW